MQRKLSRSVAKRVDAICKEGNRLADGEHYDEALERYKEAFRLLPEPKEVLFETTWVIASIGDMLYHKGETAKALDAFEDAVRCPGGLGNTFIHLRLGQIHFDLGHREKAADELMRAFMGGGREAFAEQNPKYYDFLRQKADLGD
jgi:tetratricopeptide (TPR) repeat protein